LFSLPSPIRTAGLDGDLMALEDSITTSICYSSRQWTRFSWQCVDGQLFVTIHEGLDLSLPNDCQWISLFFFPEKESTVDFFSFISAFILLIDHNIRHGFQLW